MTFKDFYMLRESYEDYNDGIWVHYTNSPKLGIHPRQSHRDPAGIYVFPAKFTPIDYWRSMPYKYTITLRDNIRIMDLSKLTKDEMYHITPKDMKQREFDTPGQFWHELRNHLRPGEFNKLLRNRGYDAVFDDTGTIHIMEKQLLILDPTIIKDKKLEINKIYGFDKMKEIFDNIVEIGKKYGECRIDYPVKRHATRRESWDTPKNILRGLVTFTNKDHYSAIAVEWDQFSKSQQRRYIRVYEKYGSGNGLRQGLSFDYNLSGPDHPALPRIYHEIENIIRYRLTINS